MSKSMPAENAKKTKSAPSGRYIWVIVLLLILVIGGALFLGTRKAETKVQLSSKIFKVDVADNPEAHSRGLSGRSGLGEDQGMLFVFDKPAVHCFWMKDMSFDIDILWFDKSNKLIHQERNVSPSTYPGQRFCPDKQAKYVLEVRAGTAESLDLSQTEELQIFNL